MSLIIKYGESLTREVLAAVPEDLLSSLVAQSLPSTLTDTWYGIPSTAITSGSGGGSLLHLALRCHCQVPVIELLSGLHPNAAKVTDAKGRLPLALAIEVKHPSMEVLELLVSLTSDLISAVRVELFIQLIKSSRQLGRESVN